MKQAIIMRGISGAGKSTLVAERWPDAAAVVCSDDYYPMPRCQGRLTSAEVHAAYRVCLDRWMRYVAEGATPLVLDRQSLTWAAVRPYAAVAKARGYHVLVVTVHAELEVAAARNKHGVSLATEAELAASMEDAGTWPTWISLEDVMPEAHGT